MSENLTRLAHKIDFSKDESEEKGKPTSECDKEDEAEQESVPNQPSLWPWDSIRAKLRYVNFINVQSYLVIDSRQQLKLLTQAILHCFIDLVF